MILKNTQYKINLGLCCINLTLKKQKPRIFTSRTVQRKTLYNLSISERKKLVYEIARQNLQDVITMMEWNYKHNIFLFRLSSNLLPRYTDHKVVKYDMSVFRKYFTEIGRLSKKYKQRLTFHPGPFNILNSLKDEVYKNTIRTLEYHVDMLDLMRLDQNSVVIIHGGSKNNNKNEAKKLWCKKYILLSDKIKRRLVLENCERIFNIEDCLEINQKVGVPVVFDTHHFNCYNILFPGEITNKPETYMNNILSSWKNKNITPLFHISEQGRGKIGHHSDYVTSLPLYLLNIPQQYQTNLDIMVEAKAKEQAVINLKKKYNI